MFYTNPYGYVSPPPPPRRSRRAKRGVDRYFNGPSHGRFPNAAALDFAMGPDAYMQALQSHMKSDVPEAIPLIDLWFQQRGGSIRQQIIDAAVKAYRPMFLADVRAIIPQVVAEALNLGH